MAAGLGRVVAFGKDADFVGRAALEAVRDAPPSEHLVGLISEGRRAPRAGYRVLGDDGEELGRITSGALSPTLARPIAMAYVQTSVEAGRIVTVDVRGSLLPASVVALPFYRRSAG
jgi:aminomethyltransferase